MRFALALILLVLPAAAGDSDTDLSALVERLFDKDPAVRAAARAELSSRDDASLADVLRLIEQRQSGGDVVRFFDVRDLQQRKPWWTVALSRVRALAPDRITMREGALVARAPADIQKKIAALLTEARREAGKLVAVDVRLVRLRPGTNPPDVLKADQLEGFLATRVVETVGSPRLTCYDGQKASISVISQVSYVADYEFEAKGEAVLADPVIDTFDEGVRVELRPVRQPDGTTVRLALEATVSSIRRPIPTLKLRLPFRTEVGIQVPETTTRTLRRLVTCRNGDWAVLSSGEGDAILVRATPVNATDLEPPGPDPAPR